MIKMQEDKNLEVDADYNGKNFVDVTKEDDEK